MRSLRFAAAIALVVAAAWLVTPVYPPLDDGYISLDSAQSVLAGGDAQYGSPPLTGVTSPPYTFLLLVFLALRFPALIALRLALALGLAALVVSLWALARSAGSSGWRRFALPAMVLVSGPVIQQATNGVETGWAMAAAVTILAASLAERPFIVATLAGLIPWLRPDLTPLAGLLFLWTLRNQSSAVRVRAVTIAAIAFLPWPVWIHQNTGSWIPQTMAAKAAFFEESCQPLTSKATTAAFNVLAWARVILPAALLAAAWVPRTTIGRIAIVASLVTIAAFAEVLPGGLRHNDFRYLYPIGIPLVALGFAQSLNSRERPWQWTTAVVVAASVALLFTRPWSSNEAAERVAAATWIREHVDSRARILVHDAGAIAVFTDNPLVDLVGLKTPSSIGVHRQSMLAACGYGLDHAVTSIARASNAQYFVVTTDWDHFYGLTGSLRADGFTLTELRAPPLGEYGYKIFRMERR